MTTHLAVLTGTEIQVGPAEGPFESLPSRYAEQYERRTQEHAARNAWKQEQRGGMLSGAELWGRDGMPQQERPMASGVARGFAPGQLVFTLEAGGVQTVLQNKWDGEGFDPTAEVRLASHNDRQVTDLSPDPAGHRFACAVRRKGDPSHVAVMSADGKELVEVTGGDSDDGSPVWHPTELNCIVYESAGLGRSPEGHYVGRSPSSLMCLEVKAGRLETLHESPKHDHVAPRFDVDGKLHCIRRPYMEAPGPASLGTQLADAAMAPIRIGVAVVGFLDHFARRYSGKGLGAKAEAEHVRQHEALARRRGAADVAPPLPMGGDMKERWRVPEDWTLVRFEGETPTVVATRVFDYDLLPDGGIVYSDGTAVFMLGKDGAKKTLVEGLPVRRVVVLPGEG